MIQIFPTHIYQVVSLQLFLIGYHSFHGFFKFAEIHKVHFRSGEKVNLVTTYFQCILAIAILNILVCKRGFLSFFLRICLQILEVKKKKVLALVHMGYKSKLLLGYKLDQLTNRRTVNILNLNHCLDTYSFHLYTYLLSMSHSTLSSASYGIATTMSLGLTIVNLDSSMRQTAANKQESILFFF